MPAADSEEVSKRFKAEERFRQFERLRLFTKFGPPEPAPEIYDRLSTKLRKKLKQTKVRDDVHAKCFFIEVPSNFRLVDKSKLNFSIDAVKHSRTTLGVMLANREPNPRYRLHYSLHAKLNTNALYQEPELASIFDRFATTDTRMDVITELSYQSTWQEALDRLDRERADRKDVND